MLRNHGEWLTGTNGGRGKITGKAEEYLLGSHGRYIKRVQVYTCMWIDEHTGTNTRGGVSADRRLSLGGTFLAS